VLSEPVTPGVLHLQVYNIYRPDDTSKQVWWPKWMICKFSDRDTKLNKLENLNERFLSLETETTQMNKLDDPNDRFASLGIEMTQPNKFDDR
jgi:hypothetical protein